MKLVTFALAGLGACAYPYPTFSPPDRCKATNQAELDTFATTTCTTVTIGSTNDPWTDTSISVENITAEIDGNPLPDLVTSVSVLRSGGSGPPLGGVNLYGAAVTQFLLEDSNVLAGSAASVDATLRCNAGGVCRFFFGSSGGSLTLNINATSKAFFQGDISNYTKVESSGQLDVWSVANYTIEDIRKLAPPKTAYQLFDALRETDDALTPSQIAVVRYVAALPEPRPAVEVHRTIYVDTGFRIIDVDAYVAAHPE
jgi:hypothetical protein